MKTNTTTHAHVARTSASDTYPRNPNTARRHLDQDVQNQLGRLRDRLPRG